LIRNKNTGPTEEERRKRREKKEKENKGIKKKNKWNDFLTGFLLTLSNPLIVFLIIGLFARFNFFLPEYQIHHYIIGYIFIVAGAICWWMIITRFVDKVRNKFSNETIRKLNIMIGLIILIMSAVGIFTGLVDYLTLPQVGKII
jgi:threonine/homoserine/homoserine lactone efflux protein